MLNRVLLPRVIYTSVLYNTAIRATLTVNINIARPARAENRVYVHETQTELRYYIIIVVTAYPHCTVSVRFVGSRTDRLQGTSYSVILLQKRKKKSKRESSNDSARGTYNIICKWSPRSDDHRVSRSIYAPFVSWKSSKPAFVVLQCVVR